MQGSLVATEKVHPLTKRLIGSKVIGKTIELFIRIPIVLKTVKKRRAVFKSVIVFIQAIQLRRVSSTIVVASFVTSVSRESYRSRVIVFIYLFISVIPTLIYIELSRDRNIENERDRERKQKREYVGKGRRERIEESNVQWFGKLK